MPEDVEEEVNTQKDSFVLKPLFKDPDALHVVNDLELTIKKMFIMDTFNLISPVLKQEPHDYCELEVAKGSEWQEFQTQLRKDRVMQVWETWSQLQIIQVLLYMRWKNNKTGKSKSPHLGPRNADDDKANLSKKISLKVVDVSDL